MSARPAERSPNEFYERWCRLDDRADGTVLFTPQQHLTQPILVLFGSAGRPTERIVVRKTEFRIGREEGDLLLPHDLLVSGRHAVLVWRKDSLKLMDEGSRNGTFWRVRDEPVALVDGRRFLCGRQIFQVVLDSAEPGSDRPVTKNMEQKVALGPREDRPAVLLRFNDQKSATGEYRLVPGQPYIIGRDPAADIPIEDDCLSPAHARIVFWPQQNACFVDDLASLNGVYVRVADPIGLQHGDMFRLGEQLFGVMFHPSANG